LTWYTNIARPKHPKAVVHTARARRILGTALAISCALMGLGLWVVLDRFSPISRGSEQSRGGGDLAGGLGGHPAGH
jgi:hypothetical protein